MFDEAQKFFAYTDTDRTKYHSVIFTKMVVRSNTVL